MKSLLPIVGIIVLAAVLLKLIVVWLEPRLTFIPSSRIGETPADYGISYREYEVKTSDGERLCAWHLEHPAPKADILFFHGNAGNISTGRLDLLISLFRQGYSVLIFDYRGYGKSTGSPTEEGVCKDSRAITRFYWEDLHKPGSKTVYLGRSLGGFTASCAARDMEPDGLILEATFPDKATLLENHTILKALSLFSRYSLSTIDYLEKVKCPILVIHGDLDEVVPIDVGRTLYARISNPEKRFLEIPGATHADQYLVGGNLYWTSIDAFISGLEVAR